MKICVRCGYELFIVFWDSADWCLFRAPPFPPLPPPPAARGGGGRLLFLGFLFFFFRVEAISAMEVHVLDMSEGMF